MEEQLHLLTGAYALNAVNDIERMAFEKHALVNAETSQEVRELSETAALLAYAVPEQAPPPELKASVMAAIRNTRQLPASSVARDASRRGHYEPRGTRQLGRDGRSGRNMSIRRSTLRGLAVAATVVVLAAAGVGGWAIGHGTGQSGLEQQLSAASQQQQEFLSIVGATDAKTAVQHLKGGTTVTVASSASADRAAVVVQGMPPAPAGKTYELWYISGKGAVPAGLMAPVAGAGPQLKVLNGQIDGAGLVGITVEPDGGSAKPTTTPILLQQL